MTNRRTKKPATARTTARVVHHYDDQAGMTDCRAPGFTHQRTQAWDEVTCPQCLAGKPAAADKPTTVVMDADEMAIVELALRLYAAKEAELRMADCWGNSAGQRAKAAEYDWRIERAEQVAARVRAKLAK